MTNSAFETVERNRRFLKSTLRELEYLECQGLFTQGRRDDGAVLVDNVIGKGNFKALFDVMSNTDEPLRSHLETHALEILPISLKRPRTL